MAGTWRIRSNNSGSIPDYAEYWSSGLTAAMHKATYFGGATAAVALHLAASKTQ
jgi:hypothetical protein